ncbi:MAG TPA: hypothetical protein VFX38_06645, partial [Gammaproteobacteria bacterium]|nr:hypothetical protein [Gammaproteobacteria bacterium]
GDWPRTSGSLGRQSGLGQPLGAPDLPDVLIFRNRVKPVIEKDFAFPETEIRCMYPPSRLR